MRYVSYFFWFAILIASIIFATLNSHSILLNYYFSNLRIYLPLLLLLVLMVGMLFGMLALAPTLWRTQRINRRLKQHTKQIELEIHNLRKIPIKDGY